MNEARITTSAFIATSLDGFIAREDGDIDWLSAGDDGEQDPSEDYGYAAFAATVDVLVMGRGTYEKVLTFEGWPYGSTSVIVLSSRPVAIPDHLADRVEAMSATPREVVAELATRATSPPASSRASTKSFRANVTSPESI